MDYSSYDYHQYQEQPQAQQEQEAYDSSQIQPTYDYSSQSYYPYTHQYDQNYHYYPPSHEPTNTDSYTQQSQPQFQPPEEPTTSIHPPGVPIPPQQNSYYPPQGALEHQQQLNTGSAAVAAGVSQFTQFSGNVHPSIGHSPYRGRGRRGGRSFRGGGRGHVGIRPDGSTLPFRGKGRGQGGGRHFLPHGAGVTATTASAPTEDEAASVQPPSALFPGQAPLPVQAQVPTTPFWPPPRMAWCELCRVDCNTPEILEQHKNGKRHKKNLQKHEELQRLNKVITGQQNVQMPNSELKSEVVQSEKVGEFQEKQHPSEDQTSEPVTDDKVNEKEHQEETVGNSEVLVESQKKPQDQLAARGHGFKRNMRGGRGGKYMRTYEGARRPVQPSKPKQVIPLMCELCNVKCDSQVVFESHLTGKKHLGNLKRFHGHRALYGELGLQALYPPNLNAPPALGQAGLQAVYPLNSNAPSTSGFPQFQQQGVNDPQLLLAQLLMTYVLSQTQVQPPLMVPPAAALEPLPSSVPQAAGPSVENLYKSGSESQRLGHLSEAKIQNNETVEAKDQPQPVSRDPEAPSCLRNDTNTGNVESESIKEGSVPSDNPVVAPR